MVKQSNENPIYIKLWDTAKVASIHARRTKGKHETELAYKIKNQCLLLLINEGCPEIRIEHDEHAIDPELLSVSFGQEKLHTKRKWLLNVVKDTKESIYPFIS